MITKGFNLFTTSPSAIRDRKEQVGEPRCCEVCTSPFLNICKPFCKYRKATHSEWLNDKLRKGTKR